MSEQENNQEDLTNKNKFYYVLSFIPFVNLSILFLDIDKDELLKKFLTQGLTLLLVFFVLSIILPILWLGFIWKIVFIGYFFLSIFLAGNAYNGKYIDLGFIQKISEIFGAKKEDKKDNEF